MGRERQTTKVFSESRLRLSSLLPGLRTAKEKGCYGARLPLENLPRSFIYLQGESMTFKTYTINHVGGFFYATPAIAVQIGSPFKKGLVDVAFHWITFGFGLCIEWRSAGDSQP